MEGSATENAPWGAAERDPGAVCRWCRRDRRRYLLHDREGCSQPALCLLSLEGRASIRVTLLPAKRAPHRWVDDGCLGVKLSSGDRRSLKSRTGPFSLTMASGLDEHSSTHDSVAETGGFSDHTGQVQARRCRRAYTF